MIKKKDSVFVLLLSLILLFINGGVARAVEARSVSSPYLYNFNSVGILVEASSDGLSTSPYWWVNSGGYMLFKEGKGSTYLGLLPSSNYWRNLYARNNPTDTDNGYHPQNIFRLVTRSKWGDTAQEVYFNISKDNLSSSSNRDSSNGLLLLNRYQNDDNLYYAGVRVDGSAVIKKKQNGSYHTMALVKGVYPGNYDRSSSPNLLPKNKWIGLRSEVENIGNNSVEIRFYTDEGWTGNWRLIAKVVDNGSNFGGNALTVSGYSGIRTDFMDVLFENYKVTNI